MTIQQSVRCLDTAELVPAVPPVTIVEHQRRDHMRGNTVTVGLSQPLSTLLRLVMQIRGEKSSLRARNQNVVRKDQISCLLPIKHEHFVSSFGAEK
jgi:hypothetical protein